MKRLAAPLIIILALAALALWGAWQNTPSQAAQPINCPDPVAGCWFMHNGLPAKLQFSTQPMALKPFMLAITSANLRKASASFRMSGMDMGFNRYDLRPDSSGSWSANVTLPVCTVSRVEWIAELDLDGRIYSLTFSLR